jgi:hypothetical protein
MPFLTEIEKSILKFLWKQKAPKYLNQSCAKTAMLEVSQCLISNYTAEQ